MPTGLTNSLPYSTPTGTSPGVNYKMLYNYGHTSYTDPKTGKVTYMDRYNPATGVDLAPMDLTNPAPIADPAASGQPDILGDKVNYLLAAMSPGAGGGSSSPVNPFSANLMGMTPKFSDLYGKGSAGADQSFKDLLSSIGSAKDVDAKYLDSALEGIDIDTNKAVGSTAADFADRGLLGPNGSSDIAANAIAQVRSDAGRNKAAVRSQLGEAQQKALQDAYASRYGTEAQAALTGAQTDAGIGASLLGQEYSGGITREQGALNRGSNEKMNYMNSILDYAVKKGSLSQQDAQFYAQLISGENQAGMDRTAAYDRALLSNQDTSPGIGSGFLDSLVGGVGGGLGGLVTTGVGKVGSGLLNSFMTKKPKSQSTTVKVAGEQ